MPQYVLHETLETGEVIDHTERYGVFEDVFKNAGTFPSALYNRITGCYVELGSSHYSEETDEYVWTDNPLKARLSWHVWKDANWRFREKCRFSTGEYTPLPWTDLEPIVDHFAHVSTEDGTKIAFTEDDTKGQVDRQTRMKPGRYLAKFYPHLSQPDIQAMAVALDKAIGVRFVETADDMERVYTNGPNSCMAHSASDYSSHMHPVRVYAAGDLQVAYLSALDITDANFRASARCLVWPARKRYGRIYGDEARLAAALRDLGYEAGQLTGARLLKVEDENECDRYVMPYIDGAGRVDDRGSYFVIDASGSTNASNTNGLADEYEEEEEEEDDRNYCAFYDEHTDDEVHHVRDVNQYWSESAIERHAFLCAGYDAYFSNEHGSHEVDGETYSERYCRNNFAVCEGSGDYFNHEDVVILQDRPGVTYSLAYAENNFHKSDDDGLWYSHENATPRCTETADLLETLAA